MRFGLDSANSGNHDDRECFPAQSSVLDEVALLERIAVEYDIPVPRACVFFARGDSDVYKVHTDGPTYYMKIYRPPHPLAWAESEARLVVDLAADGVPVSRAVRRRDGGFATEITASEGRRPLVVFEEAPDGRLDSGEEGLFRRFGRAVGDLHDTMDRLSGSYDLQVLDWDWPARVLLPSGRRLIGEDDYEFLIGLCERMRSFFERFARELPDFGLCHCDLVPVNVRCADGGALWFFDFGNAAFTWRARELAVIQATLPCERTPESRAKAWEAFLDGYGQVRALPLGTEKHLPAFALLQRVTWIARAMACCPLRMGTENFHPDWVRTLMPGVRELANRVLNA